MVEEQNLEEQIERCRLLASMLTYVEMRQSLEELANHYEARLRRKGAGFMLQNGAGKS